jgi:hypothetical protein
MGWERRQRGSLYYTTSRREGGRIVRTYIGRGEGAEAIAQLDALDRAKRAEEAEAWRAERERVEEAEDKLKAYCELVDATTAAVLSLAGYHRHDRGPWRRKRHDNNKAKAGV